MWNIVLLFILSAVLVNCGLQKPAPALLKGEEFHGRRDLESMQEYHLMKDNIIKNKSKKMTIKIHKNIQVTNCKFIMPIEGEITEKFKSNTTDEICKDGIKIASRNGSDVVASASGKVIYVGQGLRWYGNLVIIEHKDHYTTVYSYLKNIYVAIGDEVQQDQIIGSAGKSSTQDKNLQICFTMRHNGQAVDPLLHMD